MKKSYIITLLFLSLPVMATESVVNDFSNTCGNYKILNAVFEQAYTCASGYYLPANSTTCESCLADFYCGGGTYTFNETTPHGIIACDSGTHSPTGASSASQCVIGYTCASGQYLPKNTTICTVCPNGYICAGGTFMFNENSDQGLLKTGTISDFTNTCGNYQILNAVFELAQPTCASGQYLPANTTSCVACPNGYTCAGGTFTFDANIDQGIVGNTITVIWNGATAEDVAANNAGTITYGGDIRTPVRVDPSQIPVGKRFVGWVFRKPVQN